MCEGDTFKLKIAFHDAASYQWLKDGDEINNATDSVLVLSQIVENMQGNYACRISNITNSGLSGAVLLQIKKSTEITDQPLSELVGKGATQVLEVRAQGQTPLLDCCSTPRRSRMPYIRGHHSGSFCRATPACPYP